MICWRHVGMAPTMHAMHDMMLSGVVNVPTVARVGPANIQTSVSDFLGKQIDQAWACIPEKYLKCAQI
jgi:hypothetical protein